MPRYDFLHWKVLNIDYCHSKQLDIASSHIAVYIIYYLS